MRYVLIDFMHLVHKCIAMPPLSATVKIGDEVRVVDTIIPTHTIKSIYNYGGRGQFYVGVCLEGGASERKAYFEKGFDGQGLSKSDGYKGNRQKKNNSMYQGADLAVNLMNQGKVSLYRQQGFEADDLIASLVQIIKSVDKTTPIDVITNDSDLLPLVDDQVSVYMRSTLEYTEEGCPSRRLYYQVTPNTWNDYLQHTSAHKDFYIPYNSMLLFKMIRGDKSDNVPATLKGYGGVKYSNLMYEMEEDGVDFPNIFRYGVDFDEVMRPVLTQYFDEHHVDHMKYIYEGIRPRYSNLAIPKQIELGLLQAALTPLKINLMR